ncbi:TlpA family protein disulfide reductase [Shewanella sp. AS16]|uniref:TlpA family protein disulfide reductase n=1 Tax=Shewanella sp. AS16 TaxID=2907625 RepID=UPI001F1D781E|nr:TlpA disulfide reductase family protein [Shewanella sp. AS16]MCE9687233.1 TlpA family protein disulfide reductase [Shewanella sp. AS16]
MKICLLLLSLLGFNLYAAPSLEHRLLNPEGELVSLTQFKGQVVYLDFWASWCAPCRKSFPWMNSMQAKYGEQGLTVVAVNLDVERALADKFLQQVPANFQLRFDPEGNVARSFELLGMPSSYLFDRQGNLVGSHVGFFQRNTAAYEQELQRVLKE